MILAQFDVLGVPAPQGSTRAFVVGNRAVTTNKGNKGQMAWRDSVARGAKHLSVGRHPFDGPLELAVNFRFPMPASRPKKVRELGVVPKTTSPDLDKLVRSVCDGLQAGGLIADDARIVGLTAHKFEVVGWTGATIAIKRAEATS